MTYDIQSIKQPGRKILFVLLAQRWAQDHPCYTPAWNWRYVYREFGASGICVIPEETYRLVSSIADDVGHNDHQQTQCHSEIPRDL